MNPAADVLTDPARALAALRDAGLALDTLEVTQRRGNADSGSAGYRLRGTGLAGEPAETLGYALWAAPDRIAGLLATWRDGRAEAGPFGEGVRAIPLLPAMLFLMPNDRALPLLPSVADVARLAHVLAPLPALEPAGWRVQELGSRLDVLAHRPEQRFVARASLRLLHEPSGEGATLDAILRLFADDRGAALLADTTAWRAAGAAAVLPRPLGVLEEGHLHVEEAVAGGSLRQAVRAGSADPEAVASALGALHGANVDLERTLPADARLAAAHTVLATLRAAGLLDDAGVAAVAGPLTAALPPVRAPRPLHGDLRSRQVVTGAAGPVFVDLARRAMGDPFHDWGSLIACLLWQSRSRLPEGAPAGPFAERLAGLARASTPARPSRELAFFIACALVETAERPVRRRVPDAAAEARLALQMAREVLAEPA